ncbi:MAG: flagellar basal body L-ring protein FlgH [Firmicutes bacterium]|nr:flagellar basal body L-ring protein FlgH [Bacillota bacterium]
MAQAARKTILIAVCIFFALALPVGAAANSLWTEAGGNLFLDTKASEVGDLVTIIIVEESQATQKALTQTKKSGSVGVGPGLGILSNVLPEITGSGEDSMNASGTTTRGGSLEAKVTVQVAEVLPNGNLFLKGSQKIIINGEEQNIQVTGVVRPEDIRSDNTVLSTYVANAKITYTGEGPIGDRQKPGILTKLFHWLF